MSGSILLEKSYKFALRIVKLSQYLNDEKHEFVLSKKTQSILEDCEELQKMLISSLKTTKNTE